MSGPKHDKGESYRLTSWCLCRYPNEFLSFRDTKTETRHPIRLYSRYINKVSCPCLPSMLGSSQPCLHHVPLPI